MFPETFSIYMLAILVWGLVFCFPLLRLSDFLLNPGVGQCCRASFSVTPQWNILVVSQLSQTWVYGFYMFIWIPAFVFMHCVYIQKVCFREREKGGRTKPVDWILKDGFIHQWHHKDCIFSRLINYLFGGCWKPARASHAISWKSSEATGNWNDNHLIIVRAIWK